MKKSKLVKLIALVDQEKVNCEKEIKEAKKSLSKNQKEMNTLDSQKRHLMEMMQDTS